MKGVISPVDPAVKAMHDTFIFERLLYVGA